MSLSAEVSSSMYHRVPITFKRIIEFLVATLHVLLLLTGISFLGASMMMLGNNSIDFVFWWRWWHDNILVPAWYITPFIAIWYIIDKSWLWTFRDKFWMAKLPKYVHWIIFTIIALGAGYAISQAFGGCIWLVFTEGWEGNWVRFGGHPEQITPVRQELLLPIYIVLSTMATVWAYNYFNLFLSREKIAD